MMKNNSNTGDYIMSNRDKHTTIRVKNEVAEKLRKIQQGTDATLSDIIWKCLQHIEGTIEDDTVNISRETIAFDLQYVDENTAKVKPVTFRDCAKSSVNDIFVANPNITATEYTTETAKVIFKDEDSCIVRFSQLQVSEDNENRNDTIIHISLF